MMNVEEGISDVTDILETKIVRVGKESDIRVKDRKRG